MSNYPRNFSHIGISVPDVEKAVEFYSIASRFDWQQAIAKKTTQQGEV